MAVFGALLLGLLVLMLPFPAGESGPGPGSGEGSLILRWLLGSLLLAGVGLVDDRRGLGPLPRFAVHVLAALIFLPELSAWTGASWIAAPLGLLWILGLINSLNFLDNMDAICASAGLWTALALAALFLWAGEALLGQSQLVLAATLAGFLVWNRPPARLYLGDAGSTVIGYSLGLFSLLAVSRAGLSPWLAPLLLALPLYDTLSVFWIRWREGRPLWVGDLRHSTHRLLARCGSLPRALVILNLWILGAAALALLCHRWERGAPLGLIAAVIAGALLFARERRMESGKKPTSSRSAS
jgi:UDP-GlcNAc:undecaprenyl-phosphate GlcNAc-1-phosphate transferase